MFLVLKTFSYKISQSYSGNNYSANKLQIILQIKKQPQMFWIYLVRI